MLKSPQRHHRRQSADAQARKKNDSTRKKASVTLTIGEITSLCDRLTARATSILLRNEPEQARDLVMAAKALRALMRHVNHSDVLIIENGA